MDLAGLFHAFLWMWSKDESSREINLDIYKGDFDINLVDLARISCNGELLNTQGDCPSLRGAERFSMKKVD